MIKYRFFLNAGIGCRLLYLLAVCLMVFSAGSAFAMKRFTERVVVFEFERLNEDQMDEYSQIVIDICNKVFLSELEQSPNVGIAEFIPREETLIGEKEEVARKMGAQRFATGQYNFLRGNIRITAQLTDPEHMRGAEAQALLGKEDIENFDIIEKKVRDFANHLLEAYSRSVTGERQVMQRLLVTCFSDVFKKGYSHLGRFITLELPYHLSESLTKLGVNPDRLSVEGLTDSQFTRECNTSFSKGFRDRRYLLSGTVIQEGDHIVIKPRLFDQNVDRPFSIASYVAGIPNARALSLFCSRLAQHIAGHLTIILGQQKLKDEKLYSGALDGIIGPATWEALMMYQSKRRLPETGMLDNRTMESLGF